MLCNLLVFRMCVVEITPCVREDMGEHFTHVPLTSWWFLIDVDKDQM